MSTVHFFLKLLMMWLQGPVKPGASLSGSISALLCVTPTDVKSGSGLSGLPKPGRSWDVLASEEPWEELLQEEEEPHHHQATQHQHQPDGKPAWTAGTNR